VGGLFIPASGILLLVGSVGLTAALPRERGGGEADAAETGTVGAGEPLAEECVSTVVPVTPPRTGTEGGGERGVDGGGRGRALVGGGLNGGGGGGVLTLPTLALLPAEGAAVSKSGISSMLSCGLGGREGEGEAGGAGGGGGGVLVLEVAAPAPMKKGMAMGISWRKDECAVEVPVPV
jgi:hypothetical protein